MAPVADRIRINETIRAWNLDRLNPWSDHYTTDRETQANALLMARLAERRLQDLLAEQNGRAHKCTAVEFGPV